MDFHRFSSTVSSVIHVALNQDVSIADQQMASFSPATIDILRSIEGVDLEEFISHVEETEDARDIVFTVAGKPYVIREQDAAADDPAVYSPYGDLISNSAFTFVAVELAHWLAGHAPAMYEHRRFNIYYGIREYFDTLIKDTYYSNKLWLSDGGESYVATLADLKIVIVGRSRASLDGVLTTLKVDNAT